MFNHKCRNTIHILGLKENPAHKCGIFNKGLYIKHY